MRFNHFRTHAFLIGMSISVFLAPGMCADARAAMGGDDDASYTAKIREFTTEKYFLTELVDHLPASATVPSPLKALGYIAGDTQRLTYSQDLYRYYRELARSSPRVRVFTAPERSEEGKEQILVVISDEANLAKLDRYKQITARLADPKGLSEQEAHALIAEGKPFYWASGSIHSTETGSPEMLMELVYRLAVEETPFIETIRKNSFVMITPVLEVDGHDRQVDLVNYHRTNPGKGIPPLVYWGKYVAHDNNRDSIGMGLALSRNQMKTFLEYHPQVLHDLHESVPYLYISTGTGPYNAALDPIVIDEWHQLAYHEIGELTRRGVPGVWTHGFYDGWASNYMFFVAQGHNSIGRFYETFGHTLPDTMEDRVGEESQRAWFRPNPPFAKVKWSMRNNVNLQQSGILLGMNNVASNRERFLTNFYAKSLRAVKKAEVEGPAAYVIPSDSPRPIAAADLVNKLRELGVEVHKSTGAFTIGGPKASANGTKPRIPRKSAKGASGRAFPAGSYIVRMDQPYSRIADNLLDTQYYNVNDPQPYDDTGWTMGALRNVTTIRVTDKSVLAVPMTHLTSDEKPAGGIKGPSAAAGYVINNAAESALVTFRYALGDAPIRVAESSFTMEGAKYNPGSFIVQSPENPEQLRKRLSRACAETGITATAVAALPMVKSHPIGAPRIALVHTWGDTQNEGWYRLELDRLHVPYTYISTHVLRETPNLRGKFDVILFPPVFEAPEDIVRGTYRGDSPVPWKGSTQYPNIALSPDQTDDMRGGLGFTGLANVDSFIREGGLLIGIQQAAQLPITFGMTPNLTVEDSGRLKAQGSVYQARFSDRGSPIAYGYEETVPIYFSRGPLFKVPTFAEMVGLPGPITNRPSGRGSATDPDVVQGMPQPSIETPKKDEPGGKPDAAVKDANGIPSASKDAEKDLKDELDQPALAKLIAEPYMLPRARRPRVILRFEQDPKNLLVSGMLAGETELANRPAIVDVPSGKGHILLFANNPIWRHSTQGSFALLFNAILNFDHLDAGRDAVGSSKSPHLSKP